MRWLGVAALALVLAACSGSATPKAQAPRGAPSDGPRPETRPGEPLLPVAGVQCSAPRCVYHGGAGGYFACLSGGVGTCFHYGAPCDPVDRCAFDGAEGRYRQCETFVEGTCTKFAAACAPASGCMYSPTERIHRRCDELADGRCARWGAACTP